jgi:hypothetical protein
VSFLVCSYGGTCFLLQGADQQGNNYGVCPSVMMDKNVVYLMGHSCAPESHHYDVFGQKM